MGIVSMRATMQAEKQFLKGVQVWTHPHKAHDKSPWLKSGQTFRERGLFTYLKAFAPGAGI